MTGSPDTVSDNVYNEKPDEEIALGSPHAQVSPGSGVDVDRAEQDFVELSRELSRRSAVAGQEWASSSASTVHGVVSPDKSQKDLEKGRGEEPETTFDLREYLTSSNDANQDAGIKHKVSYIDRLYAYCCCSNALHYLLARRCHLG